MTVKGFTNAPPKERVIKLILAVLIVLCAVVCFPKNYKINVLNYGDDRKEMIVLTDSKSGRSTEAWTIFGNGYFYVSGISGGMVDELLIGDSIENVYDVDAYYGSVRIGRVSSKRAVTTDDGRYATVVSISYNKAKAALFIILYALLCVCGAAAGIAGVLNRRINVPSVKSLCEKTGIDIKDAALFLGLSIVYSLIVFVVSRNVLIKNIYPLEICSAAIMLFAALLVLRSYSGARHLTAMASLPIYACLYLSVNKICAFTFVDGEQAIMEQVAIATDSLRHFEKNTARLNYIIMGTFERYNVIGKLSGMTAAKVMHGFFGTGLLIYLVWFTVSRLLPETGKDKAGQRLRALRFTVLFCMIFTFNYTLEALKNYNYDLFSMVFGAVAFAHFLHAAGTKRPKDAAKALIWATLGLLEKQVVWPIMLLCMLEYVILAVSEKGKRPYLQGIIETLKAALITLAVSASANLWIQHVVRADNFPAYVTGNLIRPLQGMMSNLIRIVYKNFDTEGQSLYVISYLACLVVVYAGFAVCRIIGRAAMSSTKKAGSVAPAVLTKIFAGLSLLWMILAEIRWDHAFVKGPLDTMLVHTGYSLNTFTLVILAGSAAAIILCAVKDIYRELMVFMVLFMMIVPIPYVIFGTSVAGRYLNIFGLCAVICLYLIVFRMLPANLGGNAKSFAAVAGGFMAALIVAGADVSEFGPEYINYNTVCNRYPIGKMSKDPLGVERMTAGEALLRHYHDNGLDEGNVEIYVNYGGQWTAKPEGWKLATFPADSLYELGSVTFDDISFGDDVYYVFTSRAVRQQRYRMYPFPDKRIAKPFITLKRRGAIEGFIYRADDLKPYFAEVFLRESE